MSTAVLEKRPAGEKRDGRNVGALVGSSVRVARDVATTTNVDFPPMPLAMKGWSGNVTYSRGGVIAWYLLSPLVWSWQKDSTRNGMLAALAKGNAALADRRLHIRTAHRHFDVREQAQALLDNTPNPPDPKALEDYLVRTQRHNRGASFTDVETYIGVTVKGFRKGLTSLSKRSRARIEDDLVRVDAVMAGPGLRASRATQEQVEWLVNHSIGIGLPAPVTLPGSVNAPGTETDVPGFTQSLDIDPCPGRSYIRLTPRARRGANEAKAKSVYLAVLTVGRMEDLEIPEKHSPWMAAAEALPFPVEWSAHVQIDGGQKALAKIRERIKQVKDQYDQYSAKPELTIPEALDRTATRAREEADRISDGGAFDKVRVEGQWRLAVTGADPKELARRVLEVMALYRNMEVEIHQDADTYHQARTFIPSEGPGNKAHTRHGNTLFLAAAVPHISSTVGVRSGGYLGYTTSGAMRAVCLDEHYPMEVKEKSGFTPVIGGLGSGKTALALSRAYLSTLRGISTTIFDPSGPMAALCYVPSIAPYAKHVDLLNSAPGTLSPYTAIPDPIRSNLVDDPRLLPFTPGTAEYEETLDIVLEDARVLACMTRQQLAADVLRSLLPVQVREADGVWGIIDRAIESTGSDIVNGDLNNALAAIKMDSEDKHGDVHRTLTRMSKFPAARLFFGNGSWSPDYRAKPVEVEPILLVFTMAGLTLPDEKAPEESWQENERIAVPLLSLAATYASRRVYGRRKGERKVVVMDEAHFLRRSSSGKAFVERLARDSRKWNTRVYALSQKPADLLDLETGGLISEVLIGGIDDPEQAAAALRLARVPVGVGYEELVAMLRSVGVGRSHSRDFLYRDADGMVQQVRIDLEHLPELAKVYNSTADGHSVAKSQVAATTLPRAEERAANHEETSP